eukprot:403335398
MISFSKLVVIALVATLSLCQDLFRDALNDPAQSAIIQEQLQKGMEEQLRNQEKNLQSFLQFTPDEYNKCMTCVNGCWPYVNQGPALIACQRTCWVGACYAYCHDNPMSKCPYTVSQE